MNPPPGKAPLPRYRVVPHRPDRRGRLWVVLVLVWASTLAGTWLWSRHIAAPGLPGISSALDTARQQARQYRNQVESLEQREATLLRSDQISRVANKEIQGALAEREDEIAELQADVAFYERLVGATAPKKGLNVHSAEFVPEAGGSWHYVMVLTQSLNRDVVSLGELRFSIEGVRDGRLATIDWNTLHQQSQAPAKQYSFRYFQQLKGSVMLPPGFTPQRVRVSLRGDGASVDQTLAWNRTTTTGKT